jgi:Mg-chelatase subunit ChlD
VKVKKDEEEKKQTVEGAAKDISIVYCIDVSGSMSGGRINAVKKTILNQIKDMQENHP